MTSLQLMFTDRSWKVSILVIAVIPLLLLSSCRLEAGVLARKFEDATEQNITRLTTRDKIVYSVFKYQIDRDNRDYRIATQNPKMEKSEYDVYSKVIFLKDCDHKLSVKVVSQFSNSKILVLSFDRVDPEHRFGNQEGFQRYTDKITGFKGYLLSINKVRMSGKKKAIVIFAVSSNMRSGASFVAKVRLIKNKWRVFKVTIAHIS